MKGLQNVKVGDKLLVRNKQYGENIETVVNVTKSFAITKRHRFRIKDGTDRWINSYAKPATQEDIERLANANIRMKNIKTCKSTNYGELTDIQLERIVCIITNNK